MTFPSELILAFSCEALSLGACLWLLFRLSRLTLPTRRRLFTRQIVQLAIADIIFGVGATIQDVVEFGEFNLSDPTAANLCTVSSGFFYFGRAASVLTEVHIAVSLVCSVLHIVPAFQVLSMGLPLLIPFGFGLSGLELATRKISLQDSKCFLLKVDTVGLGIIAGAFAVTLLAYLMFYILRTCGHGTLESDMVVCRTCLYPVNFFLSYGLMLVVYFEAPKYNTGKVYLLAQLLQHLNGFLNVTTYAGVMGHAFAVMSMHRPSSGLQRWEEAYDAQNVRQRLRQFRLGRSWSFEEAVLLNMCYMEGLDLAGGQPRSSGSSRLLASGLHDFTRAIAAARGGHENSSNTPAREAAALQVEVEDASPNLRQSRPDLQPCLSAFVWTGFCGGGAELSPAMLEQVFIKEKYLGSGSFGRVELATAKMHYGTIEQGCQYAVKLIPQPQLSEKASMRYAFQERDTLRTAKHPGVVQLVAALQFQRPEPTWVLVMEYCAAGTIAQKLRSEGNPGLPVSTCRQYAAECLEALCHLHRVHIMHRDLKPTNILLSEHGHCKIADFGLATMESLAGSLAGSPGYVAPEVFSTRSYGAAADLYSYGMVLLAILSGSLTWNGATALQAVGSPQTAIDLIARATAENPKDRGTAEQLKGSEFFEAVLWEQLFVLEASAKANFPT